MYPNHIEISGARANDDQQWRIQRIYMIIAYAQALADIDNNENYYKKLKSIYDDKGTILVTWSAEPEKAEKEYIQNAWNSIVTDFECNDIVHII